MESLLEAERYARQLTKTVLFTDMTERQVRHLLQTSSAFVKEYPTGAFLFSRTDKTPRLCIILRGSADVARISSDGMMHMSTLRKNDLCGAASLFGGKEAFVTDIRCNEPVRALIIPEQDMLVLLSENQTVLKNYLGYLNERIRFLNKRLDAFSKNTVAARLLTFFVNEADQKVYTVKSFTKLSEALCVSRATLYRALDALETSGQIRRNGKQITITEV